MLLHGLSLGLDRKARTPRSIAAITRRFKAELYENLNYKDSHCF